MDELLQTLDELRGEIADARDELTQLRDELDQERAEREAMSSVIDDLTGEIDDLKYALHSEASSNASKCVAIRGRGRPREFGEEMREKVRAGRAAGESVRALAARLGISPSTVQRFS